MNESLYFMCLADEDLERFLRTATDVAAWELAHAEWKRRNGVNWRAD